MTRFNTYETAYSVQSKGWPQLRRQCKDQSEFLQSLCNEVRSGRTTDAIDSHFAAESKWWESKRPYFNVWPCILGMLKDAAVDIPFGQMPLAYPSIAVCLPEGEVIKSILFTLCKPEDLWYKSKRELVLCIHLQVDVPNEGQVVCFRLAFVDHDDTFSSVLYGRRPNRKDLAPCSVLGEDDENALIFEAVHICSGVCILANDPKFIEPIVLNRDLMKFENADEATKQYMIDRAARNKGLGFDVGKSLEEEIQKERGEMGSHFRRPHMALFWTGKGRSTPVLKLRRGSIINPRSLTEVPTGFLG